MSGKWRGSLLGTLLSFGLIAVWLFAAENPQARRDALMKTYQAGNWKDAYDGLRKLALDPQDDPLKVRFNYQPTFASVKDQYILASNKGLCRELIGILQKEDRTKLASQNMQMRVYASSLGSYANVSPDQSLANTIIAQALKLDEAKQQTDAIFAYVQKVGSIQLETDYTPNQFRFDLVWKTRK